MSMGSDDVSGLQPQTDLLFIPRWYMSIGNHGGIISTGWNRRTPRKTCPSATLCTTNASLTEPGTYAGLRGERPATNRLSHFTTSSSSSLARQLYVGPGLPQQLLPAKVIRLLLLQISWQECFPGWGCQPHAQPPAILEGRCFLSGLSPLAD
jgi:hypothetical protein